MTADFAHGSIVCDCARLNARDAASTRRPSGATSRSITWRTRWEIQASNR